MLHLQTGDHEVVDRPDIKPGATGRSKTKSKAGQGVSRHKARETTEEMCRSY